MRRIRKVAAEVPFLVPGVGAQGGNAASVVGAGLDARGSGLMISSSRGILYSDDPAAAARALRDEIGDARDAAARKAVAVAD
jgi:orotidine-5'-phosphate decarboxylase